MNGISFNNICQPYDEKLIVTACSDSTLRVWNYGQKSLQETLYGHTQSVNTVTNSVDIKLMASASDDHSIIIWDSQLLFQLQKLVGHQKKVSSLVFLNKGQQLLSGGADYQIKLWNLQTFQIEKYFLGHVGTITGIVVSFDSSQMFSVSDDQRVIIWDVKSASILTEISDKKSNYTNVMISNDEKYFITCSKQGKINIWQTENYTLERTLFLDNTEITQGIFSKHKNEFVTLYSNDQLVVWNCDLHEQKYCSHDDDSNITYLLFSEHQEYMIAGKQNGSICIYDSDKLILTNELWYHQNSILQICYHQDIVVSVCLDGIICIWQTKTTKLKKKILKQECISSIALTNDGKYIIAGNEMGQLITYDVQAGSKIDFIEAHDNEINQIIINEQNEIYLSCSDDATIKLWTKNKSFQPVFTFEGHVFSVNTICFTENQDKFFSGGDDKYIILWNLNNYLIEIKFDLLDECVNRMQLLKNENMLLITLKSNEIKMWNLDNYTEEMLHIPQPKSVNQNFQAVSNGNYLVIYNKDLKKYTFDQIKYQNLLSMFSVLNLDWSNLNEIQKDSFNPFLSQQLMYCGTTILHILCYIENEQKIIQLLQYLTINQLYFHMTHDYEGKNPLNIALNNPIILQHLITYLKEVKWSSKLCNCCAQAFSNFFPLVLNAEISDNSKLFKKIIRQTQTINVTFPVNNKTKIVFLSKNKIITDEQLREQILQKPQHPLVTMIHRFVQKIFFIQKSNVSIENESYRVSYIELANIDQLRNSTIQLVNQIVKLGQYDEILESRFVDTLILLYLDKYFSDRYQLLTQIIYFGIYLIQELILLPEIKQNIWCSTLPLADVIYSYVCYPNYYKCLQYGDMQENGPECIDNEIVWDPSNFRQAQIILQSFSIIMAFYFIIVRLIQFKYGQDRLAHLLKLTFYITHLYLVFFLNDIVLEAKYNYMADGYVCIQKTFFAIAMFLNSMDEMKTHSLFIRYVFMLRVLTESFKDLRWFMLFLFLSSLTYSFGFYVLQDSPQIYSVYQSFQNVMYFFMENIDHTVKVISNYSKLDGHVLWGVFYLIAFYNMVFLMNIMIAIITETYEKACTNEKAINNLEILCQLNEVMVQLFNRNPKDYQKQTSQNWVILIEKMNWKQMTPSNQKKELQKFHKISKRTKVQLNLQLQNVVQIQKFQNQVNHIDIILNEQILALENEVSTIKEIILKKHQFSK